MKPFKIFLVTYSLFLPFMLKAGGIELNYEAIRTAGMGNVGTSLSVDASAVFANPGAMGFLYHNEMQMGLSAIRTYTTYSVTVPYDYDTTSLHQQQLLPHFYGVFRFKRESPWTFGLSVNSPYGIQTNWPDRWVWKFTVQQFSFRTLAIQPTFSYRLGEKWGFGGGIMYYLGDYYNQKLKGGTGASDAVLSWAGTGKGWGVNLGAFYKINEKIRLGFSYRSAVDLEIDKGKVSLQDSTAPDPSKRDVHTGFTTRIKLPNYYRLGITLNPKQNLSLSAEAHYSGWKRWDSLLIKNDTIFEGQQIYKKAILLRNSFSLHAGVEWKIRSFLYLRGGMYYMTSPVKDEHVSPEYPDANRFGLTLGLGAEIAKRLTINGFVGYAFTDKRTGLYIRSKNDILGIYQIKSYQAGVSLGYLF